MTQTPPLRVSVIIPALNEEQALPGTLASLRGAGEVHEIIVADGGSTDGTEAIARGLGAKVTQSAAGRGRQLAAGAANASGDIFWFVHADAQVAVDAVERIRTAVAAGATAGNFRLRFTGDTTGARFTTAYQPVLRALGWVFGDSGIFATRDSYAAAGGIQDLPIFEDVDFVKRVRRVGRFVTVPAFLTASSRRFEGRYLRTFSLWTLMQMLYLAGVSPQRLGRMYRNAR